VERPLSPTLAERSRFPLCICDRYSVSRSLTAGITLPPDSAAAQPLRRLRTLVAGLAVLIASPVPSEPPEANRRTPAPEASASRAGDRANHHPRLSLPLSTNRERSLHARPTFALHPHGPLLAPSRQRSRWDRDEPRIPAGQQLAGRGPRRSASTDGHLLSGARSSRPRPGRARQAADSSEPSKSLDHHSQARPSVASSLARPRGVVQVTEKDRVELLEFSRFSSSTQVSPRKPVGTVICPASCCRAQGSSA